MLFSPTAPDAFAVNTWQVPKCADSGAGSLRGIVAIVAASGDTVDFSQLNSSNCPTDQNLSNRVSGASIDIGAYELQQGDIVFNPNFEGCP